MTKYELPKGVIDRYFSNARRVTNIAVTMAADYLTKDLIGVFEIKRDFYLSLGYNDYANGVQDCIDHLKDFLKT